MVARWVEGGQLLRARHRKLEKCSTCFARGVDSLEVEPIFVIVNFTSLTRFTAIAGGAQTRHELRVHLGSLKSFRSLEGKS